MSAVHTDEPAAKRRRKGKKEVPPIPGKGATVQQVADWLYWKFPGKGYGGTFKAKRITGQLLHVMQHSHFEALGVDITDELTILAALPAAGAAAAAGDAGSKCPKCGKHVPTGHFCGCVVPPGGAAAAAGAAPAAAAAAAAAAGAACRPDPGAEWLRFEKRCGNPGAWEKDEKATKFIEHLVKGTFKAGGAGLQVLTLPFGISEKHPVEEWKLVMRKSVRELWQFVFDGLEGKLLAADWASSTSRVVVTGNPGIGKSFSALYLIRLLCQSGRLVLFESRGDWRKLIAIVPPDMDKGNKKHVVYTAEMPATGSFSEIFPRGQDPNAYAITDPTEAHQHEPDLLRCKQVYIPSLDPDKGKAFEKDAKGKVLFLGVWKEDEILRGRPHMAPDIDEKTVKGRLAVVGGLPRYVFADKAKVSLRKKKMVGTVNDDMVKDMISQKFVSIYAKDDQGSKMSTHAFAVHCEKAPFSAEQIEIKPLSPFVYKLIFKMHYNESMALVSNPNRDCNLRGVKFEDFCEWLLEEGASQLSKDTDFKENCKVGSLQDGVGNGGNPLFHERTVMRPDDLKSFVEEWKKLKSDKTLLRAPHGFSGVDYVDRGDRGYNATVAIRHDMPPKTTEPPKTPLRVYYMVPGSMFDRFKAVRKPEKSMDAKDMQLRKISIPMTVQPKKK